MIELIRDRSHVILIDAVTSGTQAGTLHPIDLSHEPLPDRFRCFSTHAFGIPEAVEMARALDQLPEHLIFHGIEAAHFGIDQEISAEVLQAAERLIGVIHKDIQGNIIVAPIFDIYSV